MTLDPRELAKQKFEQILTEQKNANERANEIIWAAVSINAGLGFVPLGINFWTFIGVSTVMVIWLGSAYGLHLSEEGASQIIKQIFSSVGAMFFMTTLGLKFFAEVLKGAGVITMGGTTVAGMALDAILCGAVTYAIGFTSKEMFKRNQKMSSTEIRNFFKQSFEEGKQKVKETKHGEVQ